MASNLSPALLATLAKYYAPSSSGFSVGDITPYFDAASNKYYAKGANDGYVGYDKSWGDGGDHYGTFGDAYGSDGTFSNQYAWNDGKSPGWDMAAALAIGGGALYGAGMLGGAAPATGGGLSAAGDAVLPGALGAGGSEVAYGSLIPGLESYAVPAGALGGAAGGGFNAAMDSQAANAAIDAGGGDALAGYTAAGAGGVTASPIAATGGGFWDGIKTGVSGLTSGGTGGNGLSSLLGPAATLAGGIYGANKAGDAADAQIAAADRASALQEPFRQNGLAASNELTRLLGLRGDPASAGYGDLTRNFSAGDLNADPVYQNGLQFGLNEGTKAINNRAAAGGSFLSGATLKALSRFGNDYGTTKANESYNRFNTDQTNRYNRLAGVAGSGQTAATQVGSNTMGAGNAQAAGIVGGANAISSGIGGALNSYQQNQLLKLIQNPGATSYGY